MKLNLWKPLAVVAVLALAGCHAPPPNPAEAVLAVVRTQIDALNREDLAGVLATMDPASPGFEQTREMTTKIFQAYDLRYTLKELTVESVKGDEAKLRFNQVTEKISGPNFRNNRVEGVHTLKKHDGQWKLFGTETNKIEYLDK